MSFETVGSCVCFLPPEGGSDFIMKYNSKIVYTVHNPGLLLHKWHVYSFMHDVRVMALAAN